MSISILEALNVHIKGSQDNYVVFAHDFSTNQSAWQCILPYFTQDYKVILYDLTFAGRVNPDYLCHHRYSSIEAYVDDLLCILDSLSVMRCAYVRHSISAIIGMLTSIRRPELFTKLILIGASPRYLNDEHYRGGFDPEDVQEVFLKMEQNYQVWVEGFASLAIAADVPQAIQEFSRTLFNTRPDISLYVSQIVFGIDLRGILGLVKVPCWILQCRNDVIIPASMAIYMKHELGGPTTVLWLNTEGHLPFLSAPFYFNSKLNEALS